MNHENAKSLTHALVADKGTISMRVVRLATRLKRGGVERRGVLAMIVGPEKFEIVVDAVAITSGNYHVHNRQTCMPISLLRHSVPDMNELRKGATMYRQQDKLQQNRPVYLLLNPSRYIHESRVNPHSSLLLKCRRAETWS